MEEKGILNAFALKLIMAALMLLDHIYWFLPHQPLWFHILGRTVAPVFCFLMTQSLAHTRDRRAYLTRMTVAGLAMLAVNSALEWSFGAQIPMDIFLSLAVGGGMVTLLDHIFTRQFDSFKALWVLVLAVVSLFVEGGVMVPAMAIIFYFLRHSPMKMCAVYVLAMTALVWVMYGGFSLQHYMVFAVVPILLYNGRRGPGGKGFKWFFYLFYPLHIWALYFVAVFRLIG